MSTRRIIFMGTPEFAVATLDALIDAGMDVAAVITAPDRPAGRGKKLQSSAVKQRASQLGLPILQPEKLKDPAFIAELDRIDASLYMVVAFRMLPEVVWNEPALGTVNLHASLLPAYRGAAPINWAIINGERTTGVTTFRIQHEIDTGDILLQEEMPIGAEETAGELHDRMMHTGSQLMVRTVNGLFDGTLRPRPQSWPHTTPPPIAPKIDSITCRINWDRSVREVHDLIRGMSPYPGAWCRLLVNDGSMHFKILRSRIGGAPSDQRPGSVRIEHGSMWIACNDGMLEAIEVQPEGKRRMAAVEFLRGMRAPDAIHAE